MAITLTSLILFSIFILTIVPIDSVTGNWAKEPEEIDNTVFGFAGYYKKFRYFMGEVGNQVKEVMVGLDHLHKGFKHVEEFLDATVDEECNIECEEPGHEFFPDPNHVPSSNGCGSLGVEIPEENLPLLEFAECCHNHDICYGTCLNDKDWCDLHFKKCLYKKCSEQKESVSKLKHKGCQAGAKLLYMATTALGCKPFIDAQREACICRPRKTEL